jgi:catechol 2,3-dioxygenase-like lactoylglutathione lyase family enzyme
MPKVTGPDFIAFQVADLEESAHFYGDVLGLPRAAQSSPDAVVFATSPIPFAVRKPVQPFHDNARGQGLVLWFACQGLDELHTKLKALDVSGLGEPTSGPFGRTVRLLDPDGYPITLHEAQTPSNEA